MAQHERLLAWQRAHELALAAYAATGAWPASERYGLVTQVRRSASAVGANIAEGAARHGPREFRRFLNFAQGSLGELENHLRLARDLGLLTDAEWARRQDLRTQTSKLVYLLVRSLR